MMSIVDTVKDKVSALASSIHDLNKLTVDKIEDAAGLNIASANYFSGVCIKQLRILGGIRDLDSVQKFTADSISLSGDVAKRILDDGKSWLSLGADYTKKASDIFKNDSVDIGKKPAAA